MPREYSLFHASDKHAIWVGDFGDGGVHGVLAEVDSVTLFFEDVLTLKGKMIAVFVGEGFCE